MSRFFINRPIVAIVIALGFVLGGSVMIFRLPVAQFPEIAPPQIQTTALYTGADALTVEQSVATPIDTQVNGAKRMIYEQAIAGNDGTMTIQVSFDVDTNIDIDQVQVQNRLAQAQANLPSAVNAYGLTTIQTAGIPLLLFTISSPNQTWDQNFLSNYLVINVQDELARVPGIGQVRIFGAANYAMRVWVAPDTLANMGLTITDLVNAISAQNTVNPAGTLGGEPAPAGQELTYTVRARGRLMTADEFGDIVVRANADGSLVRLKDVARIELGAESYTQQAFGNGRPAALLGLYQVPGSNALDAAHRAKETMARLAERFPGDMRVDLTLDTTIPVTEGAKEICITLLEAIGLVIIVVFLFLQNWRATLIPILTIPVSLVGTFLFFPALGFTTNTLSLLGLVLAVGLVVDDAIVVVEAIEAKIEEGLPPREAALHAMDEVSGALVGIALVLSSVFIPAAFIAGITGALYRQFALTIAFSVLISAFNALTLSPALGALLLRPRHGGARRSLLARFFGGFDRAFASAQTGYVRGVRFLIHKIGVALVVLAAFALLAGSLGKTLPTSFMPQEDQGFFFMNVQLPEAASMQRTNEVMRKIDAILQAEPGVHYVNAVAGYSLLSQTASPRNGLYFVQLAPYDERATRGLQADAIVASVNRKLYGMPEARVFAFLPPAIPGVGQAGGVDVFVQDRAGKTVDYLWQNTQQFMAELQKRPEIAFVATTFAPAVPQMFAHVDEDRVFKLGVPIQDVYTTLQALLGGTYVNQFNRFGRVWRVFLQGAPEYRTDPADLGLFYVRNQHGDPVPLSTLVQFEKSYGPEYSTRFNEYRAVEVLALPAPGCSSGQAMAAVAAVADHVLPRDMGYAWNGMTYQESIAGSGAAVFALSLVFVFLILAALYESWSLPWSVLLSTPVAVAGAFVGIWARGLENDVYAQIGLLMLIGLSAKNAILIVEFARAEREQGASVVDAALNAARKRLRPILMTSFAFIFGLFPLWSALGAGGIARQVIGTVTIVGMAFGTGIAIFLVPVLFALVERLRARRSAAAEQPPSASPSAKPAVASSLLARSIVTLAVLLLGGCAPITEPRGLLGKLWGLEVGPDYRRPAVDTPDAFRDWIGPEDAASFADVPWWDVFGDPALRRLVTAALSGNYDLQAAAARIDQARAQVGIAASDLYPQIGYQGTAARSSISGSPSVRSATFNSFLGALNLSWEIDLWGRIRRSTESARAQYLATEEARRGVVVSLVGDMATSYFELLELDREVAIMRESADTYRRTLEVFTQRYAGGTDTQISTSRAAANLEQSVAAIAALERRVTQQENAISVLMGTNPAPVERGTPLVAQTMPETPPGLTTTLLQRRPDIRQAEQSMIAANAEVGVAVANFFPKVGLSTLYGSESSDIGKVVTDGASVWNIAANMSGPIFQGGRLIQAYHAQQAFWDETIAQYRATIVEAFREVGDALTAEARLAEQRKAQEQQVVALRKALDLSLLRYSTGLSNYIEVLDAAQLLYPAESALAQTERDQLLAVVNLYKALGGGWEMPGEQLASR